MGLFINEYQNPGVFKNTAEIKAPNQTEYRCNHLSEFILDQNTANEAFLRAIKGLRKSQYHYGHQQITQSYEMNAKLQELKELNIKHELVEKQVYNWLEKLEQQNHTIQLLIKDEQLGKNDLTVQIEKLDDTQNAIMSRLEHAEVTQVCIVNKLEDLSLENKEVLSHIEKVDIFNDEIMNKVNEQNQFRQIINEQFNNLEDGQKELTNRVDNQEGLMEKILRQIDHVRTSLFERTSFLEEKMEKIYHASIASYQKIKNGSE